MIVNLRIKANKLQLNGSSRKKLNPFCQLTRIESTGTYNCENEKHVGIGRTETISNCQHPYWFRNFEVEFELGDELYIIFDVYHEEDEMERKLIGSSTFEIGNILGHKLNRSVKLLQNSNGKNDGLISVMIERYEKSAVAVDKALMLKLSVNLQKKHRVFYELERQLENDSWQPIYRTEYDNNMEKVMTKVWDECEIPYSSLTSSSMDEDENTNKVTPEDPTLRIKIMSYSPKKGHTVIGYAKINVNSLSQSFQEEVTLELENKNNNDIGQVKVMYIFIIGDDTNDNNNNNREIDDQIDNAYERRSDDEAVNSQYVVALPVPPEPSFVDYITGDCSMNLYIAIDFTSSNGDPRQPSSPHYIDPYGQLNDYENAIFSIGEIVAKYDTDQKFPVWGFGAKFQGIVRHAFELGGKAEVSGINGVLEAYRGIFQSGLVMSSPTVLTEVIEIAASQATHSFQQAAVNGGQAYGILLILSNGNDSDINKTKETLKRVANAPLSVIIVGIGNNDFSGMHHLDNFHEVEGGRDLCNFVEFEKYRNEHISVLRSATLNEIPSQLSSYFHMRGIMPSSKVMYNDI